MIPPQRLQKRVIEYKNWQYHDINHIKNYKLDN